MKSNSKNKYGQYFTPDYIADYMVTLSSVDSNSVVLEPCCGKGVFLKSLENRGITNITAYEIDSTLNCPYNYVKNESYISAKIDKKYDLIIGNPPYIRWKNLEEELKNELKINSMWNKYCNELCDYLYIFIIKSVALLKTGGELIFICPEYWMNTTHSLQLRNYLINNGYFTKIIHFSECRIFKDVNSSIMIFKYIKDKPSDQCSIEIKKINNRINVDMKFIEKLHNDIPMSIVESFQIPQFKINERWVLANHEIINEINALEISCKGNTIGNVCDIGNGMVSGLDSAFQINNLNILTNFEKTYSINVVKGKDTHPYYYNKITPYIFIPAGLDEEIVKKECPNYYAQLKTYENDLINRYQYGKHINFWEWVFPRNYKLLSQPIDKIFVPCKERISNKQYFRFSLAEAGIYSTQDVTALCKKEKINEKIEYILAFLNTPQVFQWVSNKGIVKGNIVEFSETPLSSIPFRSINWNDSQEINIHDRIVNLVKNIQNNKTDSNLVSASISEINSMFKTLLHSNHLERKHGQTKLSDNY